MNRWLACGVSGPSLGGEERQLLAELGPGAVVLFARNIESDAQLCELTAALAELPSHPVIAIDGEGGRVHRLRPLLGPLPSAVAAARAGCDALAALGAALGAGCAHFGISVDYAPVVDVARGGRHLGGEERCFGGSVDEVVAAAGIVIDAIERFGVATCLKHYPGLGSGAVDSHLDLPMLDGGVVGDECAFLALQAPARAVMVAHALVPAFGEAVAPGSLSSRVLGRLDRDRCGPILSDDLEMGALERFGSLPERAAAALLAGCDQVLICNDMAARSAAVEHMAAWARRDPALAAALTRAEARLAGWGAGPVAMVEWFEVEEVAATACALAGVKR